MTADFEMKDFDDKLEAIAASVVVAAGFIWETLYQAGTDERYLFQFTDQLGVRYLLEDNGHNYTAYRGMTGDQYWGYVPKDGEPENEENDYEGGMDDPPLWQLTLDEGDDAGEFCKLAHLAHLGALTAFIHDLKRGLING